MSHYFWKRKSSDLFLLILYYLIYCFISHTIYAIDRMFPKRRHPAEPFLDNFLSLKLYIFTVLLFLPFISPFWVYNNKVPKWIEINSEKNTFCIYRKRKQTFHLNLISYSSFSKKFYHVFEIYIDIYSPNNQKYITKKVTTFIALNFGMSWGPKIIAEIVDHLKKNNVPEQTQLVDKTLNIWKYMYNK